ncbi:MAG: class I SAM-dependent methyltransferase family protein [Candidatus Altiarchaeota archaeon]|nr:class I SAM-dependent methyltransferase family protein [Candidatus Altiarchaeota archaeon]
MHLKVERKRAESFRKRLLEEGVLDSERRIMREDDFIYIPITQEIDLQGTEIVHLGGRGRMRRPMSLVEALKGELTEEELSLVPRSFDLIGDIAVLEIPRELAGKKKAIGAALVRTFRNVKVVAVKKTGVETEYRVRDFEVVAGENRTETVHKEYGCLYRLDVSSAYFSPRLGTERMRVARQVSAGERVLVLFAGVGPYPVLIAKKAKPGEVYAVELNPKAFEYMKENISLNKVCVTPVPGDAAAETRKLGLFDRIIMPLPKDAGDFLDAALPALNEGGVIHFYTFTGSTKEASEKVTALCRGLGYEIEIIDSVECGSYSAALSRMCVDFRVSSRASR